jgi:hypothetical protein
MCIAYRVLFLIAFAMGLSGCAAAHTAIAKRDLDVQNKMTDTIFLDPVAQSQKTVYVQTRNTSDKPDFDLRADLRSAVQSQDYTVVDDPDRAHYLLQVTVLQVGKIDPTAADSSFLAGYGSAIGTTAAGATIGVVSAGTWMGAGIGGLIGGATAVVADALVKDVTYTIITDVQVSERTGMRVSERTNQRLT